MNGKMLRRIEITGFRLICSATVDFGNINTLIGTNGARKSNLVSVLSLIQRMMSFNLQKTISERCARSLFSSRAYEVLKSHPL